MESSSSTIATIFVFPCISIAGIYQSPKRTAIILWYRTAGRSPPAEGRHAPPQPGKVANHFRSAADLFDSMKASAPRDRVDLIALTTKARKKGAELCGL